MGRLLIRWFMKASSGRVELSSAVDAILDNRLQAVLSVGQQVRAGGVDVLLGQEVERFLFGIDIKQFH